jgi:phosphate ABC transporter phosphate-binding protein
MTRKLRQALAGAALALVFAASPVHAADITLNETGSTLLLPVFQAWIAGYKSIAPDVTITAAGTGSGAGEKAALDGSARIGTSDAYLSDRIAEQNPQILDIPLAISAQTINYNLPGLNGANLKIDGPTLAAIYTGMVTQWDDPTIKAMNPGAALPHQPIVPVRRADGAGDTFIFTQFLDFSAETWENSPGYGTEIAWPKVDAEKAAEGNDGVVKTLAATPYTIGYVGISYGEQIAKANLRHSNGQEPSRQVPAPHAAVDRRRGRAARPAHAPLRAHHPYLRARRQQLSADQLRIRRRLKIAAQRRDGRCTSALLELGDLENRRQQRKLSEARRFHRAARLYPRSQRAPDQPDRLRDPAGKPLEPTLFRHGRA